MPQYHLGSLDAKSKLALSEGEITPEHDGPRPSFLLPRSWTRASLHSKKVISWDTRIFVFKLEHDEQILGLPVGQHLMIRIRDPVTREAIIRSYTPISDITQKGYLHVLVKVYFATNAAKGGQMSMAMDALPMGHGVDFKGPIGKFEYLGKGVCAINGDQRTVKRFVMISGGSGITPIFQVFRAVMQDSEDKTTCTVFDGNRLLEDVLCKEDIDALLKGNEDRAKVLYTLTKAPESWQGLRGRIDGKLVQEHCTPNADTMVLICGPDALEKSMHKALLEQGWTDKQLVFF